MGQLILGEAPSKAGETKKESLITKGLQELNKKGYLNAHYSAKEVQQMLSPFGKLEQYLVTDDNK